MTRHGDEQAQVLEWAYTTLSQDQALADALGVPLADLEARVWPDVAPSGTGTPWVVYSAGEGVDRLALGPEPRLGTVVPLNVRIVSQSEDPGVASAAARRVYALLHGARNVPVSDGGTILTARRVGVLNYPEDAGGIQYRHTGGLWSVEVN